MIINLKQIKTTFFVSESKLNTKNIETVIVDEIPTLVHNIGFDKTTISKKVDGIQIPSPRYFTTGPENWYEAGSFIIEMVDGEIITTEIRKVIPPDLITNIEEHLFRYFNRRLSGNDYFITKHKIEQYILDKIQNYE